MKQILAIFAAIVIVSGVFDSAYAHTQQVVGDYTIEIGWQNEPPTVGKENAITVGVTMATADEKAASEEMTKQMANMTGEEMAKMSDMGHDNMTAADEHSNDEQSHGEHDKMAMGDKHDKEEEHHGEGVTGLASKLTVTVTLNNKKTVLNMTEDKDDPGQYMGKFTPQEAGYPIVHISGDIKGTAVNVDFHPEKIEKMHMSPLEQQKSGVAPNKVECSEGLTLLAKKSDQSAICVHEQTAQLLIARGWATSF